jgi:hypothetical protein
VFASQDDRHSAGNGRKPANPQRAAFRRQDPQAVMAVRPLADFVTRQGFAIAQETKLLFDKYSIPCSSDDVHSWRDRSGDFLGFEISFHLQRRI